MFIRSLFKMFVHKLMAIIPIGKIIFLHSHLTLWEFGTFQETKYVYSIRFS